jgi:PiT family inorganic phosphate transporter
MPAVSLFIVVLIVLVALGFAFTNGLHDAANSTATLVSTHVLSPRQAVAWASFFNLAAFLVFGTAVAQTIGTGMIDVSVVTPIVVLAGLVGAICWNIFTWLLGLPTSSSHALIGAYAGAAIAKAGPGVIIAQGWLKTVIFIFLAPLIGLVLGVALIWIATYLGQKKPPDQINPRFRKLTLVSSCLYSLGHGGNDAQKTMGIIASFLFSAGYLKTFKIPLWVALSSYAAIALGTLSGGWQIVKTMGQKITKLRPIDGFCAETASAASIFLATHLGAPVSTTHVIIGAILGLGATRRLSAVHWGVTIRIVWAWILTIPVAGLVGGAFYFLLRLILKVPS